MELEDYIENEGLDKALFSIYPKLSGIDLSSVIYNKDDEKKNPVHYLTSDIDGDWYFGLGSMPMIFKAVSKDKLDNELNKLLLSNQISKDDNYNEPGVNNIDFWNGDGFKIEITGINDVSVILITNANVVPKSSQTFLKTKNAKPIKEEINWIKGLDTIYDSESIEKENKSFSNFINVPILFKEDIDYILIKVQTKELAEIIINKIVSENGGENSFESETHDGWSNLLRGYSFVIGYIGEHGVVRINSLEEKNVEKNSVLDSKIHSISNKLNTCIEGFSHQVFYNSSTTSLDGRFYTNNDLANPITAYFKTASQPIKIFKDIVVSYNQEDEFLNINDASVVRLFKKNKNELITFDVDDKFRLDLTKEDTYYKMILYPPGGIYGNWDNLKTSQFEGDPPFVSFSQYVQELKTIPISNDYIDEQENLTTEQERENFLNDSVIDEDEITTAYSSSIGSVNSIFWRLFWVLIAILLMSLLFRSCNSSQTNYNRGVEYFKDGNTDKGFKYIDKAIENNNEVIDPYLIRGVEYLNINEFSDAEYDFSKVIELDPNNWEAYYFRARSYMGQATSKYSPYYKKAIKDFNTSIELESRSINAKSFYYRAEAKEISLGTYFGCLDFISACEYDYKDACQRYKNLCYPETGFMPYKKYFGDGIYSGEGFVYIDNTKSITDALVVLQNINTGIKIRSQFIRKGEDLTMKNIPNGFYKLKRFHGNKWTFDKIMPDGITRGGFTQDVEYKMMSLDFVNYVSWELTLYNVVGGTAKSEDIDFNTFIN